LLKERQISFPSSLKEQKAIVKKLDTLSEQTKKLDAIYKQKLADLEELKKSVLKKAFSGGL
jgi:type I restriction enzyme S subunit